MYVVKYTKSPRDVYVGYIKNNGKFHFFAGKTIMQMYLRGRVNMKKNYDTPFDQVILDRTQMDPDEFPSHLIDNKWHCVWWTGVRKDGEPAAELGWKRTAKKKNAKAQLVSKEPSEPSYDFHITRAVDGKIKVYGCVLINEYSAE